MSDGGEDLLAALFAAFLEKIVKYVSLEDLPVRSPFPGFQGRFIRSEQMTFVYWEIAAGTLLPVHSHMHEQVAHTFEGRFEITVDGQTQILEPDSVFVIPPNAVHSGKALTDCRILDVFSPVREDYVTFEQEDAPADEE